VQFYELQLALAVGKVVGDINASTTTAIHFAYEDARLSQCVQREQRLNCEWDDSSNVMPSPTN
jgi:hypothetical protein